MAGAKKRKLTGERFFRTADHKPTASSSDSEIDRRPKLGGKRKKTLSTSSKQQPKEETKDEPNKAGSRKVAGMKKKENKEVEVVNLVSKSESHEEEEMVGQASPKKDVVAGPKTAKKTVKRNTTAERPKLNAGSSKKAGKRKDEVPEVVNLISDSEDGDDVDTPQKPVISAPKKALKKNTSGMMPKFAPGRTTRVVMNKEEVPEAANLVSHPDEEEVEVHTPLKQAVAAPKIVLKKNALWMMPKFAAGRTTRVEMRKEEVPEAGKLVSDAVEEEVEVNPPPKEAVAAPKEKARKENATGMRHRLIKYNEELKKRQAASRRVVVDIPAAQHTYYEEDSTDYKKKLLTKNRISRMPFIPTYPYEEPAQVNYELVENLKKRPLFPWSLHKFDYLPPFVQLTIWDHAIRDLPARWIEIKNSPKDPATGKHRGTWRAVAEEAAPGLFFVSPQARKRVKLYYTPVKSTDGSPTIYCNFNKDTFCFRRTRENVEIGRRLDAMPAYFLQKLKFALWDVADRENFKWIDNNYYDGFFRAPNLQMIQVVYRYGYLANQVPKDEKRLDNVDEQLICRFVPGRDHEFAITEEEMLTCRNIVSKRRFSRMALVGNKIIFHFGVGVTEPEVAMEVDE